MTITELESLLKRAEDVQGKPVNISRYANGQWSITVSGCPDKRDIYMGTLDQCVTSLKKWATPPKPDMLPVLVPIATAEFAAAFNIPGTSESSAHSRKLSEACREALAPYQQPE